MRSCLQRDSARRPTVEHLLDPKDAFLYPDAGVREGMVEIDQELLGRILSNVVRHCQSDGIPTEAELASWPALFFTRIRQLTQEGELAS